MQILNVDDDPDGREMFSRAIRRIDPEIEFIAIDSGENALAFLSKNEVAPDYIFMDINMPRMNGYECVQEIHQNFDLRNTIIVMHSTTFNPRDQVDFGVLGLKYLLKTSSVSDLAMAISKLMQSKLLEERR